MSMELIALVCLAFILSILFAVRPIPVGIAVLCFGLAVSILVEHHTENSVVGDTVCRGLLFKLKGRDND